MIPELMFPRQERNIVRAVAAGIALVGASPSLGAVQATCDVWYSIASAFIDESLSVSGAETAPSTIPVSPGDELLVIAEERGVDIRLGLVLPGSAQELSSDNPAPRAGIQRITALATASGVATVNVRGNDVANVRGSVRLRVIRLPKNAAQTTCLAMHRSLAVADDHYAHGLQVASRAMASGRMVLPEIDKNAPARSQAAAAAYADVASGAARSMMSNEMLGAAQLAAGATYYDDLSDWTLAYKWSQAATHTLSRSDDVYLHARAKAMMAAARMEIAISLPAKGETATGTETSIEALTRARTEFSELANFHAKRGERYDQALNLNNIGLAYFYQDLYKDALPAYQDALKLYAGLKEPVRKAQVLNNIALTEYSLGNAASASRHYGELLKQLNPDEQPQPYAYIAGNKALADMVVGNMDTALEGYSVALSIWQTQQNQREVARNLHGIATVYYSTGDFETALQYYQQALTLRVTANDSLGRINTLRAIANLRRELGDATRALELHREALRLAANQSDRSRLAIQIARDLEALGRQPEGRRQLDTMLEEKNLDAVSQVLVLAERGRLGVDGATAQAEQDLQSSLPRLQRFGLQQDEFDAWIAHAKIQSKKGKTDEALRSVNKAIALAEVLRRRSANPELRGDVFATLRPAYELKIRLLTGDISDAFNQHLLSEAVASATLATAEQSRARALEDYDALIYSRTPGAEQLMRDRQDLLLDLATQRNQLEVVLSQTGTNSARASTLQENMQTTRRQLLQVEAKLASNSTSTDKLNTAAANWSISRTQSLHAETAVVAYWLGATQAYAWVARRGSLKMFSLGASSDIELTARHLHDNLRNFASQPLTTRQQMTERLYDLVIRPLYSELAGTHQLVIVPDGALHYVPVAALRDRERAGRYLIQDFDISFAASVNRFMTSGNEGTVAQNGRMLLVADPVYETGDSRLTAITNTRMAASNKSTGGGVLRLRSAIDIRQLRRLPGTAAEAKMIKALFPAAKVDVLEGLTATRASFLAKPLQTYQYIHVASHAISDAELPQLSSLILSTVDSNGRAINGRVMAGDLLTYRLNAQTVVFSACDTALGKRVTGEGLVGLSYVALARGAHSVVASLWPASDQISARLLNNFYSGLVTRKLTAPRALADAMRNLLQEGVTDPALWATFAVTVRSATQLG